MANAAKPKGRPTKFTPETRKAIVERLAAGSTIKATCDSVGVATPTYHLWIEVAHAILNDEPHKNAPKDEEARQSYLDFLEATMRASAEGLIRAAVAFRQGMNPSESVSVTTETFEEIRLNKKGEPYTYHKTLTKRTVTTMPGDWRAAADYLGRRDPENWARNAAQKVEHTGKDGGAIILKTGMSTDDL